jgi:capsular polysaccharide biosynthesis protein
MVIGPIVHVRGTRGLAAFNLENAFDCAVTTFFPDIYDQYEFKRTVQYDKIFLARRDWRAIRNHSEVERLLIAHGYTTVYMEDFSILDQISIAKHARDVVAIHGAAMAFLALSRGVDSVIELSPPHVYHSYFPVALGSKVRKYVLVIPEHDERVMHSGFEAVLHFKTRPFEVNLRLLERALAELGRSDK